MVKEHRILRVLPDRGRGERWEMSISSGHDQALNFGNEECAVDWLNGSVATGVKSSVRLKKNQRLPAMSASMIEV
jgi:hypothetical protein